MTKCPLKMSTAWPNCAITVHMLIISYASQGSYAGWTVTAVLKTCQNFYIIYLVNMKKRFLEHNDLFKKLVFLEPKIVLSLEKRQIYPDLADVSTFLPLIDEYALASEWRILPFVFEDHQIKEYSKLNVEDR